MIRGIILAVTLLGLAACGQQQQSEAPSESGAITAPQEHAAGGAGDAVQIEPADALLVAAPNEAFTAVEPSELGVTGAPTIMDALGDLVAPGSFEGDAAVSLTIREEGERAVADVVRENIPDDSVAAGHVRVEFRRESEGWFPENGYRRWMCRRGAHANQWSSELCP